MSQRISSSPNVIKRISAGFGFVVTSTYVATIDCGDVLLNKGSYGIFLVGGGGYGDIGMMGAASGYFSYQVVEIGEDLTRVNIDVGSGGDVSLLPLALSSSLSVLFPSLSFFHLFFQTVDLGFFLGLYQRNFSKST